MQAISNSRSAATADQRGGSTIVNITVRLVNKDLVLEDFPCMPAALAVTFIDKLCTQFTLNKESLRVLTNSKLLQFNQPGLT